MIVANKGLAWVLNLRTHPLFVVGVLKPYQDPNHIDVDAIVPRMPVLPRAATSVIGSPAAPHTLNLLTIHSTPDELREPLQACSGSEPKSREDTAHSWISFKGEFNH